MDRDSHRREIDIRSLFGSGAVWDDANYGIKGEKNEVIWR